MHGRECDRNIILDLLKSAEDRLDEAHGLLREAIDAIRSRQEREDGEGEHRDTVMADAMTGVTGARCALATVQLAEARDGPEQAMELLDELCPDLYPRGPGYPRGIVQPWILADDPATGVWLVRLALAVGDRQRAQLIATALDDLVREHDDAHTVAAAAHARGLISGDPDALRRAAADGSTVWSRASAEEDLAVLLDRGAGDLATAISYLEQALAGYESSGADRDAARVRRRLRRAGIRHRHWSYADRPTTGWDSLTDTERAVAALVTQGLTNQQVANQMFISVHTVAFHLRQIFRKLGIGSRVELTRLIVERGA